MAAAWATYQERVFAWTLGLPSQFHCAGTEQPYAKVPSYWSWECLDWLLCWEANERFQPGFSLWPSAVGYFQKNPSHLILGQRRENKTKQKTKQNYQMFWLQWKKKKKSVFSVRFRSVIPNFLEKGKEKTSWDTVHCVKLIKYCAEYTVLVRGMGVVKHLFLAHYLKCFSSPKSYLISLLESSFSYFIWLYNYFFRDCME